MSILIKGMEMPEEWLTLTIRRDGQVVYLDCDENVKKAEAVELPDHGDLIDRDKLIFALEMQDYSCAPDTLEEWTPMDMTKAEIADIKHAPVVIPAEVYDDDENWYTELDDPKIAERSEE